MIFLFLFILCGVITFFIVLRKEKKEISILEASLGVAFLLITSALLFHNIYAVYGLVSFAFLFVGISFFYSIWNYEGLTNEQIIIRFLSIFLYLLLIGASTFGIGFLFYFLAKRTNPLTIAICGSIVWLLCVIFISLFMLDYFKGST